MPSPMKKRKQYFFHFPDGNASIARLLVRQLIPEAIPGDSAEDVVLARANYAKLDRIRRLPVRIRLNSTAVRVKHEAIPPAPKKWKSRTPVAARSTPCARRIAFWPAGTW